MEQRNANRPDGVDMGPRSVANRHRDESILTAIPAFFSGGADGTPSKDAFRRGTFSMKTLQRDNKPQTNEQ